MYTNRSLAKLYPLDTFLQINDQINTVLNRYEAFKRGDYAAAVNPVPSELSRPQSDLSLIDFDDSSAPSNSSTTAQQFQIDELANLFSLSSSNATPSSPTIYGQPPTASLMQTQTSSQTNGVPMQPAVNYSSRPGTVSPQFRPSATPPPGSIRLATTPQSISPQNIARTGTPTYYPTNTTPGIGVSGIPGMGSIAPQTQRQSTPNTSNNSQLQGKDPFADLVGLF
jgi:ADP-ribosylation factor-binding protein GGA